MPYLARPLPALTEQLWCPQPPRSINAKSTPLATISSCDYFFPHFHESGCSDICSQHGLCTAAEWDYLLPITTLKFKWNDVLIALL